MNEVVEKMLEEDSTPLVHQIGMAVVGVVAGLLASAGAKKCYKLALEAAQNRKTAK